MLPFALAGSSEKRQTALFGIIRAILFDDLGIEHHGVYRRPSALVKDALFHADHICRHTGRRPPCSPSTCRAGLGRWVDHLSSRSPTSRQGISDRASVLSPLFQPSSVSFSCFRYINSSASCSGGRNPPTL